MPWTTTARETVQSNKPSGAKGFGGHEHTLMGDDKMTSARIISAEDESHGAHPASGKSPDVLSFVRIVKGDVGPEMVKPTMTEKERVELESNENTRPSQDPAVQERQGIQSGESESADLPDRNSSASAPPDFEITSRALFSFKAGYTSVFSDHQQHGYDGNQKGKTFVESEEPAPIGSRGGGGRFPHLNPKEQPGMRREDSDASVEDLISRTVRMPPLSASNLARDDSEISLTSLTHLPETGSDDIYVRDRVMQGESVDRKGAARPGSNIPPVPSMLNNEMWKQGGSASTISDDRLKEEQMRSTIPLLNSSHYFINPSSNYGFQFGPFQQTQTPWMQSGVGNGRVESDNFQPAFPSAVMPYSSSKPTSSNLYESGDSIGGFNHFAADMNNPSLGPDYGPFRNPLRSNGKGKVTPIGEYPQFESQRRRSPVYNGNHPSNHARALKGVNPVSSTSMNNALKLTHFSEAVGRVKELARDQHGCRYLQTKLEEGNKQYIDIIFEECFDEFVELMVDPFGNYLCQKLFEHCDDTQRLVLVQFCADSLAKVSANMHGTRAVQRMVECFSTPEQITTACNALAPSAVLLMKDINGNHVIQRCLHRMDSKYNQFVYDAVADNCLELATHRHGCCVMQRCIDHASPAQKDQLVKQITSDAMLLVQNPYGNYVVQYVLDLGEANYTMEIIKRLQGHVGELSTQKFSSNVVEKCLQQGNLEARTLLIEELISDSEVIGRLLHDAYGNYVIQSSLNVLLSERSPQLDALCEAIRPHLPSLKSSPYGKRIQSKILKRFPKNRGDRDDFAM